VPYSSGILYNIVDKNVLQQLERMPTPYALCDEDNKRIICIIGRTTTGEVERVYDIINFHEICNPDSSKLEDYERMYIDLLIARGDDREKYPTKPRGVTDRKTLEFLSKAHISSCQAWLVDEVVKYMNRYFGTIREGKTNVVGKVVSLEMPVHSHLKPRLVSTVKYFNLTGFTAQYGKHRLPGHKELITNTWIQHKESRYYNDLSGFETKKYVSTKAVRKQTGYELSSAATWWLEELKEASDTLFDRTSTKNGLYDRYVKWTEQYNPIAKTVGQPVFWKEFRGMVPEDIDEGRVSSSARDSRSRIVGIPPIELARLYFCDYLEDPGFQIDQKHAKTEQSCAKVEQKLAKLEKKLTFPTIVTTKREPSRGEKLIEECLRSKNIPYVRQQSLLTVGYTSMKGGGLTFDFYIAVIKLAIEVDGGQHYKSIEGRGGEPGFVDNLRRDLLKNEWCRHHSTSLLRIDENDLERAGEIIDKMIATIKTLPLDELPCIWDEFQEERERLYAEYSDVYSNNTPNILQTILTVPIQQELSTLLSIEKSWLGTKATGEILLLRGNANELQVHHITNQQVVTQLKTKLTGIEMFYAVCTTNMGIVYFAGMDVNGEVLRHYDIVGIHKLGHPYDGTMEIYCDGYVELLITRIRSKRKYMLDEVRFDDNVRRRRLNEEETDEKCLQWSRGETVQYLNRYFGEIQNSTTVVMKRVPILKEGPIIVRLKHSGFINGYMHYTLPGDKLPMSKMWYKHTSKRRCESIEVDSYH